MLVFHGPTDAVNSAGVAALEALGSANDLTIDDTADPTQFNAENLARYRAVVFLDNKGDLLSDEERKKAVENARDVFSFASWAPLQLISVERGRGVRKLMQHVRTVSNAHKLRVTTAALNRFFEEVLERHPPPSMNSRPVRIYYATQVSVSPPTFVIASNYPERVHFSYRRYVINQLRERFGFDRHHRAERSASHRFAHHIGRDHWKCLRRAEHLAFGGLHRSRHVGHLQRGDRLG